MNEENEMEFRYDNSKHHSDASTFPHHKHTKDGIAPCNEPEMEGVLSEIEKKVIKNK